MQNKKREEIIRMIKFAAFSVSAGVIQIVSFTILNEVVLGLIKLESKSLEYILTSEYGICYFISLTLSVIWNLTINRKFTFKSAKNIKIAILQTILFYLVFAPLSIWWGVALTKGGVNEYIVLIGTMLINLVTEFLYQRFVVFKNSINTAK